MSTPDFIGERLQLCLLTTECPNPAYHAMETSLCPTCNNRKGRIYLLDPDGKFGMRIKCYHCYVEGHPWLNDEPGVLVPCRECHGLSWKPSTDSWAYVRATWEQLNAIDRVSLMEAFVSALDGSRDPSHECFEVAKRTLLEVQP